MIEFPKKTRAAQHDDQPEIALPAWRVELNEKVRAIQARRNNPALQTNKADGGQTNATDAELSAGAVAVRQPELRAKSRMAPAREMASREMASLAPDPLKQNSSRLDMDAANRNAPRSSDRIVEAALTRVRRASENASRAALPKIEPVRPLAQSAPLMIDKEATARALEPAPQITQQANPATFPEREIAPPPFARPDFEQEPARVTRKIEPERAARKIEPKPMIQPEPRIEPKQTIEPEASFASISEEAVESSRIITLDEIEPLDYLEAEIRKVDREMSAELSKSDSPSFFTHVVINVIDLFMISISSLPFVALVGLYNGTFALSQTRVATACIVVLIAFFYLSLTQCLCGRTFGMMFTNTRVMDASTDEPASPQRALLRSFGYFIAVAPAMIGLLWAAFNRKRRGWHDYISGTQVAGDF